MTNLITEIASPRKVNGDWGVEFEFESRPDWSESDYLTELKGEDVTVRARSGKTWEATIDEIVSVRRLDEWTFEIKATTRFKKREKSTSTSPSTPSEKQVKYCKYLRGIGAELKTHTTYTDEQIEQFDRTQISLVITALKCEIHDSLMESAHKKYHYIDYRPRTRKEHLAYQAHRKVLNPDAPQPKTMPKDEQVKRHKAQVAKYYSVNH